VPNVATLRHGIEVQYMVAVVFNPSAVLYEQMIDAVEKYAYASLDQFLEAAARNQIALHEADGQTAIAESRQKESGLASPPVAAGSSPALGRSEELRSVARGSLANLPSTETYVGPEALLWGQTNRVLPVAVGVRVLANELVRSGEKPIPLDDWQEEATAAAQGLRAEVEKLDIAADRGHGERWATALPKADHASAQRFKGQFLGAPRRDGKIAEGGAIWYGFVVFADPSNKTVTLTDAGAEWASLENPVLDVTNGSVPESTFSEAEVVFFLTHLKNKRPTEYGFLADMAALIAAGKNRVELDEAVARLYPQWAKYAETMRAGALGRMGDLGLLERERHGLTVSYHLTDLAKKLGLDDDAPEAVQ
jgi:hypothetical protein